MYGNTIRKHIQFPGRRSVGRSFPKKTFAGEPLEPRHLLAGDLVAHWESQVVADQLENGAVISEWTDSISGIVASAEGAPTLEEIALGGRPAIRLDPADSPDWFLVTSVDSPFRNIGDYTLAVVFATSSSNLQGAEGNWFQNTAVVDANSQGLANDWGLSINANGRLAAGLGNGFLANPTNLYSQETGLNDGQTHLAIVRRTGNNVAIRVDDGAFVTSTMNSNPLSTLDVAFGAQKRGDAALDGYLAEVRMYNGALDEAQLADLYSEFTTTYDNQAPQANPDTYTLAEDTNLFLIGPNNGLLLNDTDADGDALKAQLIETTTHGELGVNPDGSFIYVPDEDFFGTDSFTYAAVDFRPSAPVTVTLNVTPVHDPAVATDDSYKTVPQEALVVGQANSLLLNDLNPDNADLSVELVQDVNAGSLQLQPNGTFTYNAQGFAGTASFTYRIFDGTGYSAPATVSIVSNTPPQAVADTYQLDEDTLLTIGPNQGVLANDIDADGNTLTVEIISVTAHGDIGLGPDGSIVYSPAEDFFGTDQFTYRITDGIDPSNEATVQLMVGSVNDAPIAAADSYFTLPNSPLTVNAERGVLANDSDVDGPATVVTVTSAPQHGSLQMTNDGSFVYTPQANFEGEDAFTYVYGDSIQQSEPTRVTLTVSSRPILISELHATNASGLTTRLRASAEDAFRGDAMTPDWIELQNRVAAPLDISGMHLTDSADDLTAWQFPAGTVVPANGYLIVFASGENIADPALDENGFLHTNFNLSSDGEYLAITNEVGDVIFEVSPTYPAQVTDVSYGWNGSEYRYYDSPSPGLPNGAGLMGLVEDTSFSVKRGYFDAAFELQVTSPTVGASLVYTTDGSNPTLEEGTIVPAASPDVAPVLNLTIDSSTTLRVSAFKDGYVPTNVDTQTYFFADDLVEQSGLWDTITEDPTWGPQLKDSLLSLPAISLVLDGRISESREVGTSVEMIFPDGEEGFQIDAGVEHYGGHSLNSPKKNMRLSFKSAYGDPTLKFDLFGEGATDEFNQLLLRTGSHDNWFWVHPAGGQGHYLRNRWAFDRQLELGDLAPHGRHVQVYINGKYEGIHHLMERPDAAFMASYLGGEPEDYDALNAGTAIDGDTDAWRMLQRNEVIDDYQEVQKLLNVENYANYMLLQFYGGNDWDWNTSQNWAAARPRLDDSGFIFFHWDSDLLLRTTRTANVITRGGPGNLWNANGGMRQHPEFLMLMADRAHALFYNDGMLTNDRVRADMEALADQIRLPVIAETARWGQRGFNGLRYTPAVWEGAIEWMFDTFLPQTGTNRTETVISQLRRANVYPDVDAPEYTVNGVRQHGGYVSSNAPLDWVAAAGTTYYMLNGQDPRLPGGDVHPDALVYDGSPILLTESTVVKSRTKTDDEWSALSEAEFLVDVVTADATNIRITELNYHPYDPSPEEMAAGHNDADDFEFIELQNISSRTVDLSSLRFATLQLDGAEQGVTFAFAQAADTFLRPGEFVLVVEDVSAFETRYGNQLNVAGQWSGGLSNAEETITLLAGDDLVQQFTYQDDWHLATDGNGSSLVVTDVDQSLDDWSTAGGWRASGVRGGSPGASDEVVSLPGDANRDGVFNSSDLVMVFAAGEFEDAILGNSTWEEGDWNQDGDFTTADLVAAFQQGNYVAAAVRLENLTLAIENDVPGASNKRSEHSDRIDAAFENGAEWMVE